MWSEGYLMNQLLAARTNRRDDAWGGSAQKRRRFPTEVGSAVRRPVGDDFLLIYRISLLDLVPKGQPWEDVVALAHELEDVVAAIDAKAARLGLSRSEYLRRQMAPVASTGDVPVTLEDLQQFAETFSDLADPELMRDAWS
jgi:2,4-dienoyl-CoA reductase-like NADH-dependent reductase (Old Yellow Enzyme family)